MRSVDLVVYLPKLDTVYCIAELDNSGVATYTNNDIYPLYWWTWEELERDWEDSTIIGVL